MLREVIEGEALAWMATHSPPPNAAIVTSLPDVIEVPLALDDWRDWFIAAVRTVIEWLPKESVAIFYQSDIRHEGHWVDKGYLVMRGAEACGAHVLWHTIVCRKPAGTLSQGRATYSHMIAVSRSPRAPRKPRADVLPDAGAMTWTRAMGVNAARAACAYLKEETDTKVVIDPFCGHGTVLAAANELELSAIGVDLSKSRCERARKLTL